MNATTLVSKKRVRYGWIALAAGIFSVILILNVAPAAMDISSEDIDHALKKAGILPMANIPPPVDFELRDTQDRQVRLSDLLGKVVLLNFWTTWCPSCRDEMPALENLHRYFKGRDFTILAVDIQESAEQVNLFFNDFHLSFPSVLDSDGSVSRSFGIRSIPTTFILDKNGAMIGKAIGSRLWDSHAIRNLLDYYVSAVYPAEPADSSKSKPPMTKN